MSNSMTKTKMRSSPHSIKQWQLESIGVQPGVTEMALNEAFSGNQANITMDTRFSTWTPITNKSSNHQDCLWIPKCVKLGWFVPYTPADNEYGAWKRHYLACAADLDYLTPREAAEVYGTLNEPKGITEEMEERQTERAIRMRIRERVAEHKS
ncbi:UNVERIFIED_CONTAM: hypothetical protein FKN15_058706 [Acipenser sinensis]